MKKSIVISLLVLTVAIVITSTQVTFFVIPPIGAVPEGKTVLISRLSGTEFIDSPDAMCERSQGGVSLFCRGIAIGAVFDEATIIARMPYSSWLYNLSTGGRQYGR